MTSPQTAACRWPAILSGEPVEATDTIDCWALDVGSPPDVPPGRTELVLSDQEQARARRFRRGVDAAAYRASHAGLRLLLSRYLGIEAAAIVIRPEPGGRPVVDPSGRTVHFNLAHSGSLALVAVARHAPVGIDVEAVLPMADAETVARHHFHPEERQALAGLDGSAFFVTWTRKEAVAKALGRGLSAGFDRFSTGRPDQPPALTMPDGEGGDWMLADLDPAAGYAAAVAARQRNARLRCRFAPWDWLLRRFL